MKGFRNIANGTFSVYLIHYPFLVLFLGILRPRNIANNVSIFVADQCLPDCCRHSDGWLQSCNQTMARSFSQEYLTLPAELQDQFRSSACGITHLGHTDGR